MTAPTFAGVIEYEVRFSCYDGLMHEFPVADLRDPAVARLMPRCGENLGRYYALAHARADISQGTPTQSGILDRCPACEVKGRQTRRGWTRP